MWLQNFAEYLNWYSGPDSSRGLSGVFSFLLFGQSLSRMAKFLVWAEFILNLIGVVWNVGRGSCVGGVCQNSDWWIDLTCEES